MPRHCLSMPLSVFAVALGAAAPLAAQSVERFYADNGLRLVVASGAGGGYDTYSRVLARHYSRHLPGNPNIVVQNMPGASGMTATNWAFQSAPRDGSRILATYNTMFEQNLVGNAAAQFDVRQFNWLGSIARTQLLCVTWATSPYKTIRDVIGKPATVSATGRTGNSATLPLTLNQLLGTQFKVITGYSTSGSRLALERGEVDGICGLGISTLRASNPDWFANKRINVILQVGLENHPDLPGVPNALELTRDADRDVLEFHAIIQAIGRPYLAPPEVPAERLAALRAAFDKTMQDPAFIAELGKLGLDHGPMTGSEVETMIRKMYGYPPATVARVSEILGIVKKQDVEQCEKFSRTAEGCNRPRR